MNQGQIVLREKIIALRLEGKKYDEIARECGCGIATVSRVLTRVGRNRPRLPKEKIISLLRATPRLTHHQIAKACKCSKSAVQQIAHDERIARNVGIPQSVRASLEQDMLRREGHAITLARKYGLSYAAVLKLCRQVLGGRLRQGNPKQPLDSYGATKWPERFPKPDQFVTFLRKLFPENLPFPSSLDAWFATEMMRSLSSYFSDWQTASPATIAKSELHLLEALHTIRAEGPSKWVH